MSFDVDATAYTRFMGRFSEPLAVEFAREVDLVTGQRVLDVGCGPGALTELLVDAVGVEAVAAVDPSASFVAAVRQRWPGLDVRAATAERLPFDDDSRDVALAQLVVHFMRDPVAGLAEMARVTRHGGTVAACVWDHAGGGGPLSDFWRAVRQLDPDAPDESGLAGTREGHLEELFRSAGLTELTSSVLSVAVRFPRFEDWWEPFTLGVGPAGAYVGRLGVPDRARLRDRCAALLPSPPFDVTASAWSVRAVVQPVDGFAADR